jgi:cytochrome c2
MPMRKLILLLALGGLILVGIGGYLYLEPGIGHRHPVWAVPDGNGRQGRQAILKYGCYACHVVTGIREATGRVGPKLEEIDRQIYVGGVLPNFPENMILWIQDPLRFSPQTAMPDLGVSDQDARNIAAYLFRNP